MKKPSYQRVLVSYISWILGGFIFIGSILDVISNSFELITPRVTYVGTLLLLSSALFVKIRLNKAPLVWITNDGQRTVIKSLGIKPLMVLIGILAALWIPRLATIPEHSSDSAVSTSTVTPPNVTISPTNLSKPAITPTSAANEAPDPFPMFVGSQWSFNFGLVEGSYEANESKIVQTIGSYTETVVSIESGLTDKVRIIGVEVSGENYLNKCSDSELISGDLDVWYIRDSNQVFQACSREEANRIVIALIHPQVQTVIADLPEYVVPLEVGNLWPVFSDMAPRDDTAYQWFVEAIVDVKVPAGEFEDCYRLLLFTWPDTTIRWVCPGYGLVAAEYHHRGSIADFRAELRSFQIYP